LPQARHYTRHKLVPRIALVFSTAAVAMVPAASASHLAKPESTLFHEGKIYVSLIGQEQKNDGAIVTVGSRGNVTGTLVRASRATRLGDPKGMAIKGSTLWVTDVTKIRSFALKTGAAGRVVDLSASARFLNDLAVDRQGNLWASDSGTNTLYRVSSAGRVTRLRLPNRFAVPNGVALHPGTREIWFVTDPESGAAQVGRVTGAGKVLRVKASSRFEHLDGLAFVGRTAYFSDYQTGSIWKLSADGKLTRRAVLAGSPADISYAAGLKRLLVPLIEGGHLTTLKP
jgi:SMP-30/Gluconolactonase/LRE-like region